MLRVGELPVAEFIGHNTEIIDRCITDAYPDRLISTIYKCTEEHVDGLLKKYDLRE